MIDTRTLEECYWVGSPALEPDGMPVAFNSTLLSSCRT